MAITQPRASGAFTGRRYGSFADKRQAVEPITQLRGFGAFTGQRYGSFAGKPASVVAPPAPAPALGGVRFALPPDLAMQLRLRTIDEDELLLLMAAHYTRTGLLH